MRLDKFLAEAGIGKRKDVRKYIQDGEVKVNGVLINIAAIEIDENNDIIEYKNNKVEKGEKVYYMLNKPSGYITAKNDLENKTVFDIIKVDNIFHVGRLDKDTEGLLLFTNDGEFEHKIMFPNKHIEKTYLLWALGEFNEEKKEVLEKGLSIGQDREVLTKEAKFKLIKEGLYSEFKDEIKLNVHKEQKVFLAELTISEGKKHQVKRMIKAVGCYVVYLKRIKIGKLKLDENLKLGEYKALTEKEKDLIFE